VKKLLLAGIAVSMVYTIAARAADDDPPPPSRFRPWQQIWQCNDIRVTVTARDPFSIEYDLGGTILGRWPLHRDQRRSLLQRATLSTIATGRLLMKKLLHTLFDHLVGAAE
jgi:hypothetical protein